MLRLNAQGWTVGAIAEILVSHEHTVRATIRRWQEQGLGGLWEARGRGTKRKWQEEDMQYLEQCLEQQERTYNSKQLATVLEQERAVSLSADRIRRILQKRGFDGNERDTASKENKTRNTNN
jgi:transposase